MLKRKDQEIGYIIRYRPYTWEEDSDGEMYHNHYNPIDEFFTEETDFNERVTELDENDYYLDLDGTVYDGVDIDDMYWCELHRITSR